MIRSTVFGAAVLLISSMLAANAANAESTPATDHPHKVPAWMQEAMSSGLFQAYHPDIRWQQRGIRHYQAGRFAASERAFKEGAFYADKGSQAMLAQIYWRGEGVEADRARAYAWMDLAAERGYPLFLVEREKMWRLLDREERIRAERVGADLYAEYGDDVAKPRLTRELRIGRFRTLTGSRAGYDAGVRIATKRADTSYDFATSSNGNGSGGASQIASHQHDRYWNPKRYWLAQDRIWHGLPTGEVIVHPLERAPLDN